MNDDIKKYLVDVLTAIDSIDDYLDGKRDFSQFMSKKLIQRGVEREFEIIGEASNRVLKLDANIPISNIRSIINLRHRVIHDYGNVDYVILWRIINRDIPILKTEIEGLLKN
jgi:uncharacterized protein with HEPN domain